MLPPVSHGADDKHEKKKKRFPVFLCVEPGLLFFFFLHDSCVWDSTTTVDVGGGTRSAPIDKMIRFTNDDDDDDNEPYADVL